MTGVVDHRSEGGKSRELISVGVAGSFAYPLMARNRKRSGPHRRRSTGGAQEYTDFAPCADLRGPPEWRAVRAAGMMGRGEVSR